MVAEEDLRRAAAAIQSRRSPRALVVAFLQKPSACRRRMAFRMKIWNSVSRAGRPGPALGESAKPIDGVLANGAHPQLEGELLDSRLIVVMLV